MTVDTGTLRQMGYCPTYPGHWVRPNGLSVISQADAIREVEQLLNPPKDKKR
jgi:hypothetical protein